MISAGISYGSMIEGCIVKSRNNCDQLCRKGDASDELIKEETNERLVRAYLQKIKYLEDFQNGADLASYNYVKSMNLF